MSAVARAERRAKEEAPGKMAKRKRNLQPVGLQEASQGQRPWIMKHEIHRVVAFRRIGPLALRVEFEDGVARDIDFTPVLWGELLRPLRDEAIFGQARLDEECGAIVWPNGADFDPALLHDWPDCADEMAAMAAGWNSGESLETREANRAALQVAEDKAEYGAKRGKKNP